MILRSHLLILLILPPLLPRPVMAGVTPSQVAQAIAKGVAYLKRQQLDNGSWSTTRINNGGDESGLTGLVTLALLTAGEPSNSPAVARALACLEAADAERIDKTYSIALQTMVFSAASPRRYFNRIAANAAWLERAQVRPEARAWHTAGSWSYRGGTPFGDNSNTQYAMLGLNAAVEAGVRVSPQTWLWSRWYWQQAQAVDGGWSYKPTDGARLGTMTCAGVSSLAIAGARTAESVEVLEQGRARDCGQLKSDPYLERGIDWIAANFSLGRGLAWKYYYLYGLERAGRLTGRRYFGGHDWYREGAEELVVLQDPLIGSWVGGGGESEPLIATSFALLFLAKGRSPVLIHKLRHGPDQDWDNDPDDVRNLVSHVASDWGHPLTWQVIDPDSATIEGLLQAPILFMNGHKRPVIDDLGKRNLRAFVEQGGFLFAEACCGEREFDEGFRTLVRELFPDAGEGLRPLAAEHPVWRIRHPLSPDDHPLWGLERGCRTVVIYSPGDLSCFWNRREAEPFHPGVIRAVQVGQNVIDYATGRELPPDKLSAPAVRNLAKDSPRRGALRIAKLRHGGDWDVAPLAVPNLMSALRSPPLGFDVVIDHYALRPEDPNLVNYPLIYVHGRAPLAFTAEQLTYLRRHLDPGGGTLFADAACGSPAFDASFRRFVKELLPQSSLVPIPPDDPLYTRSLAFDLSDCRATHAAGGWQGRPHLEGVKLDGHWALIYSSLDIGCALERHNGPDCKGYDSESALRIAANIVIYATLP